MANPDNQGSWDELLKKVLEKTQGIELSRPVIANAVATIGGTRTRGTDGSGHRRSRSRRSGRSCSWSFCMILLFILVASIVLPWFSKVEYRLLEGTDTTPSTAINSTLNTTLFHGWPAKSVALSVFSAYRRSIVNLEIMENDMAKLSSFIKSLSPNLTIRECRSLWWLPVVERCTESKNLVTISKEKLQQQLLASKVPLSDAKEKSQTFFMSINSLASHIRQRRKIMAQGLVNLPHPQTPQTIPILVIKFGEWGQSIPFPWWLHNLRFGSNNNNVRLQLLLDYADAIIRLLENLHADAEAAREPLIEFGLILIGPERMGITRSTDDAIIPTDIRHILINDHEFNDRRVRCKLDENTASSFLSYMMYDFSTRLYDGLAELPDFSLEDLFDPQSQDYPIKALQVCSSVETNSADRELCVYAQQKRILVALLNRVEDVGQNLNEIVSYVAAAKREVVEMKRVLVDEKELDLMGPAWVNEDGDRDAKEAHFWETVNLCAQNYLSGHKAGGI